MFICRVTAPVHTLFNIWFHHRREGSFPNNLKKARNFRFEDLHWFVICHRGSTFYCKWYNQWQYSMLVKMGSVDIAALNIWIKPSNQLRCSYCIFSQRETMHFIDISFSWSWWHTSITQVSRYDTICSYHFSCSSSYIGLAANSIVRQYWCPT